MPQFRKGGRRRSRRRVVVTLGVAHVEHERQVAAAGEFALPAEAGELLRERHTVPVEVHARLADAHHPRVVERGLDRRHDLGIARLRRLVRMDADDGEGPLIPGRQLQHRRQARVIGRHRDDGREVVVEGEGEIAAAVQVAVGVDHPLRLTGPWRKRAVIEP